MSHPTYSIEESGRVGWVDIAKGITMLIVIWMHVRNNMPSCEMYAQLNRCFSILYMPCFFIISGFFLKEESFPIYLKKKARTLLLPLFFVYVLSFAIAWLISRHVPGILKNDVAFSNLFLSHVFTNGPIWFLSALFFALVIVYFIKKTKNEVIQLILALTISLLGFYWNKIMEWRLPMFWDSGLTAVFFVWIGKYVKIILDKISSRLYCCVLGAITLIVSYLFGATAEMQMNIYNLSPIKYYLLASIGSFSILFLSKAINENLFLQYVGKNSLVVLCFHMFVVMGVCMVCKMFLCPQISIPLAFVLSTLLSTMIIPIIKKIFFFIFR